MMITRFAAYGATKRSVVHLTKSLQVKKTLYEDKKLKCLVPV